MIGLRRFWGDTRGFVVSSETILLATVVILGCIVGLATLRDKFVQEFGDSAAAVNRLNQSSSFTISGTNWIPCPGCGFSNFAVNVGTWSVTAITPNLDYVDNTDFCEVTQAAVDDSASCIDVNAATTEEVN